MRFLAGREIQTQVRKIGSRTGEVMAAVAYWGQGGAARTGLAEHGSPASVRIICDLLSGACNPNEIEVLKKKLGFRVKMLDGLHAKVWIGGDDVIVGSANASQNGLLDEGERAADANVEAAVLLHDPTLAREIVAWFEQQWCASDEIDDWHLDKARQTWKRRQRSGGRGFTSSLTQEMTDPDSRDRFSSFRLLAYHAGKPSRRPNGISVRTPESTTPTMSCRTSAARNPGMSGVLAMRNGHTHPALHLRTSVAGMKAVNSPSTVSGKSVTARASN